MASRARSRSRRSRRVCSTSLRSATDAPPAARQPVPVARQQRDLAATTPSLGVPGPRARAAGGSSSAAPAAHLARRQAPDARRRIARVEVDRLARRVVEHLQPHAGMGGSKCGQLLGHLPGRAGRDELLVAEGEPSGERCGSMRRFRASRRSVNFTRVKSARQYHPDETSGWHDDPCVRRPSLHPVVRRFLRDLHVVDVASRMPAELISTNSARACRSATLAQPQ